MHCPVEFFYGPVVTAVRCSQEYVYWLAGLLTVQNDVAWPPTITFYNYDTNTFLSGHLHWLEYHLQLNRVPYFVHNQPRAICLQDPDLGVLRTEHQPNFTLKRFQGRTTRKMINGVRGGVQLATGGGKTASYLAALRQLLLLHGSQIKSLSVVTVTNLADQILGRMKRSGLDACRFDANAEEFAPHVVAVINSLYLAVQAGNPRVLEMLHDRNVLTFDEGHHAQAEMCYTVGLACPAHYRWTLSATLYGNVQNPYSSPGDMKIMGITGPTLAYIPARFLWEYGYVQKPEIVFVPVDYPQISKRQQRASTTWRSKDMMGNDGGIEWDLIVNNDWRNELIRRICYWRLCEDPTGKIVILVQRLKHGEILQQMLSAVGIRSVCCFGGHKIVKINSWGSQEREVDFDDKTLDEFATGDLRVLIGSQKFDEGQSFPEFTDLILAQAGKGGEANRRVYQRVGRGLHSGRKVYVWDMYDRTHFVVERQADERLTALQREGYPARVEFPKHAMFPVPAAVV